MSFAAGIGIIVGGAVLIIASAIGLGFCLGRSQKVTRHVSVSVYVFHLPCHAGQGASPASEQLVPRTIGMLSPLLVVIGVALQSVSVAKPKMAGDAQMASVSVGSYSIPGADTSESSNSVWKKKFDAQHQVRSLADRFLIGVSAGVLLLQRGNARISLGLPAAVPGSGVSAVAYISGAAASNVALKTMHHYLLRSHSLFIALALTYRVRLCSTTFLFANHHHILFARK